MKPRPQPFQENGQVWCKRCAKNVPRADRCHVCGTVLPWNLLAFKNGIRRYETRGVLPEDLRQSIEQFRKALIDRFGGIDALDPVVAGLLRNLESAEVLRRLAQAALVNAGTSASRSGARAFQQTLTAIDKYVRVTMALHMVHPLAEHEPSERALPVAQRIDVDMLRRSSTEALEMYQRVLEARRATVEQPAVRSADETGGIVPESVR